MIKILLGGSPCTHWSIAQKNGRETEPNSGLGWELFLNYKIALEKYKPDYFLYENNKSASQAIKDEIGRQLGFPLTYINSALLSAQNRQRFYVTNFGEIKQPEDRGILLKDILESGQPRYDKSPCIDANYYKGGNLTRPECQSGQRLMACEPIYIGEVPEHKGTYRNGKQVSQQYRIYSTEGKSIACDKDSRKYIPEPVRVGYMPSPDGEIKNSQGMRIYSIYGKSVSQTATSGGIGSNTGLPVNPIANGKGRTVTAGYANKGANRILESNYSENPHKQTWDCAAEPLGYAIPCEWDENGRPTKAISSADGKIYTVYEVKDGQITIKDRQYPIKLPDGYYIIRKLTVKECKRLQTIPDWYEFPVSDSQAYKMLGNGWTVEVIKHLLSHIPNIQNEEIEVLSMYDGMSCGQIALREMGCNVVRYYATEIDKYAIQTTQHNFPNTIQLGDAFQVREKGWKI